MSSVLDKQPRRFAAHVHRLGSLSAAKPTKAGGGTPISPPSLVVSWEQADGTVTCGLEDMFTRAENRQIDGGCDDCDAYQRLTSTAGVWHLVTYHDPRCPSLAAEVGE